MLENLELATYQNFKWEVHTIMRLNQWKLLDSLLQSMIDIGKATHLKILAISLFSNYKIDYLAATPFNKPISEKLRELRKSQYLKGIIQNPVVIALPHFCQTSA